MFRINLSCLHREAKRDTWATENPRAWSDLNPGGEEIGIKAVFESPGPLKGLVIYLAYPNAVTGDGKLTPKGKAIAAEGIGLREQV